MFLHSHRHLLHFNMTNLRHFFVLVYAHHLGIGKLYDFADKFLLGNGVLLRDGVQQSGGFLVDDLEYLFRLINDPSPSFSAARYTLHNLRQLPPVHADTYRIAIIMSPLSSSETTKKRACLLHPCSLIRLSKTFEKHEFKMVRTAHGNALSFISTHIKSPQ